MTHSSPLPSFDPFQVFGQDIPRLIRLREDFLRRPDEETAAAYAGLLNASISRRQERHGDVFRFDYPEELPITPRKDGILEVLLKHQTVIVQGGTGSGKSTQIPKILLEGGYSSGGLIGCTQPRRIAALSIADRLRQETQLPDYVGSKIRFQEDCPPKTRIKVMTDGILLQEFRRDPLLYDYACLVLDEAHERSLNIDILLGICRNILPRRPEFRLVITSATLDAERFSEFFLGAPVIEVEGRQFPVRIDYWEGSGNDMRDSRREGGPVGKDDEDEDVGSAREFSYLEAAALAIRRLQAERRDNLLAFLPAEKDIHELHRELEKDLGREFSILPLYGRLTAGEQKRVYQTGGKPKIILATNIAETSLTIPGIAYVVDSGLARISRYHPQTRIQGLPIEKISKASAMQRTGRAGRVKPGICVRLYSQDDFEARTEYTEPEILRSNLANVVLQLKALRLPVEEFAFVDEPPRNAFRAAYRQLHELGALSAAGPEGKLTPDGRELARLPLDVTLGKILVTAARYRVLQPAMVLAAGLATQDPRYFPSEEPERQKAVAAHRRFDDPTSDFMSLINLWNWLHENWPDSLSQRKLRNLCVANFLNYRRVREWMDLFEQFARIYKTPIAERRIAGNGLDADAVHKSVASGFLSYLAQRKPEEAFYRLQNAREAYPHPRSALARKKPEWIVASEVRQTSRVFMMRAAAIDPAWVEELAPAFCKRSYYNIAWNGERGFVEALEKATFRGFVIRQNKRVNYEAIDPEACEEMLWREGVLEGNIRGRFSFRDHNDAVLKRLERLERKLRLRNLVPDEQAQIAFYRNRAPGVTSAVALEKFLQEHGETALRFSERDWTPADSDRLDLLFPDTIITDDKPMRVGYLLDFGSPLDGISLDIPIARLPELSPSSLFELFPGWRMWVLDHVLDHMGKEIQEKLREEKNAILEEWHERHLSQSHRPPATALAEVLRKRLLDWPNRLSLPESWPSYLKFHLRLEAPHTGRRFLIAIHPGSGASHFFRQSFKALYGEMEGKASADAVTPWADALAEAPPTLAWESEGPDLILAPAPFPLALHGNPDKGNHAVAFFSDAAEAAFHQGWAQVSLSKRKSAEAFFHHKEWFLARLKALFRQIEYVPGTSPEERSAMLEILAREILPGLLPYHDGILSATPENLEAELKNDLPALTASMLAGTKAKSLADLGKLSGGRNIPGGKEWIWSELCTGAALLSWRAFADVYRVLAHPEGIPFSAQALAETFAGLPAWPQLRRSPYWRALTASVFLSEAAEKGVLETTWKISEAPPPLQEALKLRTVNTCAELRTDWESALALEDAAMRWPRSFRGRFAARLGSVEAKPAGLPAPQQRALERLEKGDVDFSVKVFAALELDDWLTTLECRTSVAGRNEPKKEAQEAGFKEKLMQDLNKRFRRL